MNYRFIIRERTRFFWCGYISGACFGVASIVLVKFMEGL
jgi:hypothetical protein